MEVINFYNQYVTDMSMIWLLAGFAGLILVLFGVIYNHLVTILGDQKEPYLPFLVAGGVFVTLLVVALFSWKAALMCLAAFTCSGIPMILGSMWRTVRQMREVGDSFRKEQLEQIDQVVENGRQE